MKNSYKATSIGATLLMAAVANSHADSLYVGADGGAAFQQNTALHTTVSGGGGDVKFNTGWSAGGEIGYNFCKYLSAELDAGVIYNNINQIGNQPLSPVGASAHLEEVPLLINGIFKWPLGKFEPYAGIGIGGAFGMFDSSNVPGLSSAGHPTYRNTDFTFAYQAELGLNYELLRHLDLGVAYRFTGTTDHSWTDNGIPLKTAGTMTQTILGTLTYRF